MEAMDFGPRHCHAGEHQQVLAVAAAVRDKVRADGELALGRRLVAELSGWFDHHVKSMDAMMVEHMRENGFTLVEGPVTAA
jgi:hemerythrin